MPNVPLSGYQMPNLPLFGQQMANFCGQTLQACENQTTNLHSQTLHLYSRQQAA